MSNAENAQLAISIHALRAERDGVNRFKEADGHISIHALRAERDLSA